MYIRQVKKVKINLWLLIFLTLFLIALIFTLIHFLSSSNANTDDSPSKYSSSNKPKISNIDKFSSDTGFENDSFESFGNIDSAAPANGESAQTTQTKKINFNGHTYNFDTDSDVTLENDTKQYIKFNCNGYTYKINTDKISLSEIKSKSDLKSELSQSYKITITSDIKAGSLNGLDIILCTISENNNSGYFIITPLNEKEVIYIELYNMEDPSILIDDLSKPIDDISTKIKTSIQ